MSDLYNYAFYHLSDDSDGEEDLYLEEHVDTLHETPIEEHSKQ